MRKSFGFTFAAALAFSLGGLISTPTAEAQTAFYERSDIYMLCDSGRAYLLSGNADNKQVARTVVTRPMCRGQGGWLGEMSRRQLLRIVPLPMRSQGAAAAPFRALHRSCSGQEERSSAATVHSGGHQVVLWRCHRQLSEHDLAPYR